jgi:activator of 2-hydroxyglutaryl-CoA dehydratase
MISGKRKLTIGLDIGSTTVKIVCLDENNKILFSKYERHLADIRTAIQKLFEDTERELIHSKNPDSSNMFENVSSGFDDVISIGVSGSGGFGVSKALSIPFTQEVLACTKAVKSLLPFIDVAIELGGEDGKITYFGRKNGETEQRMNGMCAGGTGAFIDQMFNYLFGRIYM